MNVNVLQKVNRPIDSVKAEEASRRLNLPIKLVELLFLRGIDDVKAISAFLNPSKELFHDPYKLKGMAETVERLNSAIVNKEKVVVYGDYDADGICAAAILALFLSGEGLDVFVHIPNRLGEGYGLNIGSLERIIENNMPDLILTCDCGISGMREVSFAMDLGVDVIVTDHHELSGEIPECIVINPKQNDCCYPYDMLCGAGVALKVIQAMRGTDKMLEYVDLACVATIADLVPLVDENRLIVQFGLERLNERKNLGLSVLFDEVGIDNVTSGDIAYKIAPRINAAGRMGDAYRAFALVTATDIAVAKSIVAEINDDNAKRKTLCDEMYDEAVADLAFEDMVNDRAIVLSHPSWEKGITGIVAARLAGDFNRPAFIMVRSGDTYKGTCRSVDGINVHELLTACRDLLIEFGGHSQAAGFSIMPDRVHEFKERANEYLRKFPDEYYLPRVQYDMCIDTSEIDYEFVRALDRLEPTGNGNPKPLFKLEADTLRVAPCKNNNAHISVTFESGLQIFAFNYSKLSYQLLSDGKKSIISELQMSSFGGKQVKGVMRCCVPQSLYINESMTDGYEYSLLKFLPKDDPVYRVYDEKELADMDISLYGILIIAFDKSAYDKFTAEHKTPMFREFRYTTSKNNFSRVIVAPVISEGNISFANYDKIIFLSTPLNTGIVSYLNSVSKAEILLPSLADEHYTVNTERETFTRYFELIRSFKHQSAGSLIGFFKHLKQACTDIELNQFLFCVQVFEELGFITINEHPFSVTINQGVRAELASSRLYSFIKGRVNK